MNRALAILLILVAGCAAETASEPTLCDEVTAKLEACGLPIVDQCTEWTRECQECVATVACSDQDTCTMCECQEGEKAVPADPQCTGDGCPMVCELEAEPTAGAPCTDDLACPGELACLYGPNVCVITCAPGALCGELECLAIDGNQGYCPYDE